jgi:hypothetical protein
VIRHEAGQCRTPPGARVGGKLELEGKARISLLFFVPPLVTPTYREHSNCHLGSTSHKENKGVNILAACKSDVNRGLFS